MAEQTTISRGDMNMKNICPFCEENEGEHDPVLGPLLCRKCADLRGEQAAMAERINSMGGNAQWGE